jgi:hypothetical protein
VGGRKMKLPSTVGESLSRLRGLVELTGEEWSSSTVAVLYNQSRGTLSKLYHTRLSRLNLGRLVEVRNIKRWYKPRATQLVSPLSELPAGVLSLQTRKTCTHIRG